MVPIRFIIKLNKPPEDEKKRFVSMDLRISVSDVFTTQSLATNRDDFTSSLKS
jgi:hypothetical protein